VLKIGDFSALTQVSIKTLRYYDDMGLLKPIHVDRSSNYRYYSASQLPRLYRILSLRDLGFPLEQITKLLDDGVTAEQLRGMLVLRQAEQETRVREEQDRLARLAARLRLIEREGDMNKEVVLKEIAPQWIASVRGIIPAYPAVGMLYGELFGTLGPAAISGLPVAIWHDGEHKESDIDGEAGVYLKQAVQARGRVKVYELPAAAVASVIHQGAYNRLSEGYDAVLRWVEANGYRISGPVREIYLKCSQPVRQDDESYVTEIQIPVEKV
jgi:DNA-binding transcriptional MerR regulator/predicted transcriptional regulator YdeE